MPPLPDDVTLAKAVSLQQGISANTNETRALYCLPSSLTGGETLWLCERDGVFYVASDAESPTALNSPAPQRDLSAAGVLPGTNSAYVVNVPDGRAIMEGMWQGLLNAVPFMSRFGHSHRRENNPLTQDGQWVKLSEVRSAQVRNLLHYATTPPLNERQMAEYDTQSRKVMDGAPDDLASLDPAESRALLRATDIQLRFHDINQHNYKATMRRFYPFAIADSELETALDNATDSTVITDMATLPVDLTQLQKAADCVQQEYERAFSLSVSTLRRSTLYAAPLEAVQPQPPINDVTLYRLKAPGIALSDRHTGMINELTSLLNTHPPATPPYIMQCNGRWYAAATTPTQLNHLGQWRDITDIWGDTLNAQQGKPPAERILSAQARLDLTPDNDHQYTQSSRGPVVASSAYLEPIIRELQRADGMTPAPLAPHIRSTEPLKHYESHLAAQLAHHTGIALPPLAPETSTEISEEADTAPVTVTTATQHQENSIASRFQRSRTSFAERFRPQAHDEAPEATRKTGSVMTFLSATVALLGVCFVGVLGARKMSDMLSGVSESLPNTPAHKADLSPLARHAQSPPRMPAQLAT